mmetsp:Transcript_151602/g.484595  ORF Transcript_151602/g.484595 Transcript_151602/m.484595 type:complete len:169 (-) Transcript_151602:125-631(-)
MLRHSADHNLKSKAVAGTRTPMYACCEAAGTRSSKHIHCKQVSLPPQPPHNFPSSVLWLPPRELKPSLNRRSTATSREFSEFARINVVQGNSSACSTISSNTCADALPCSAGLAAAAGAALALGSSTKLDLKLPQTEPRKKQDCHCQPLQAQHLHLELHQGSRRRLEC